MGSFDEYHYQKITADMDMMVESLPLDTYSINLPGSRVEVMYSIKSAKKW